MLKHTGKYHKLEGGTQLGLETGSVVVSVQSFQEKELKTNEQSSQKTLKKLWKSVYNCCLRPISKMKGMSEWKEMTAESGHLQALQGTHKYDNALCIKLCCCWLCFKRVNIRRCNIAILHLKLSLVQSADQ